MARKRSFNYLKMVRKLSGLTQRELALLFGGTSGSKVSRYERGARDPSFETALLYEVVFHVALDHLFTEQHQQYSIQVRKRAGQLHRTLDAKPLTPSIKRKMGFLADLIYPPPSERP